MNALSVDKSESLEEKVDAQVEAFGSEEEQHEPSAGEKEETALPAASPVSTETETVPDGTQAPIPEETEPAIAEMPGATVSPEPDQKEDETQKTGKTSVPIRECAFRQRRADGTYRQVYSYSKENVANAIKVLNAYRNVLSESGHVFFAQIPSPSAAHGLQDGKYVGWESDLEEVIGANTSDGVEVINPLEVLEQPLLNGEDLFFRTDHHWKPRAACYVAQAMLGRIGISTLDYDEYSYQHLSGFYGSEASSNPEIRKNTPADTIDVLIPDLPVKGYLIEWNKKETGTPFMVANRHTYSAYLGGTQGPWRRYETGVDCGRKCLVIGDSYICCFVPYLTPYYEEVHTTDMRKAYFDASHRKWTVTDYLKENGIDDVYIVLATSDGINAAYMLSYLMKYL